MECSGSALFPLSLGLVPSGLCDGWPGSQRLTVDSAGSQRPWWKTQMVRSLTNAHTRICREFNTHTLTHSHIHNFSALTVAQLFSEKYWFSSYKLLALHCCFYVFMELPLRHFMASFLKQNKYLVKYCCSTVFSIQLLKREWFLFSCITLVIH